MSKKLRSAARSLGRALSFRSTRSQSSSQVPSFVSSGMDIDPPSPFEYDNPSSSSQQEERYELTNINQISLPLRPQTEIFNVVKLKEFTHTPMFDDTLLHKTGMDSEFELIFRNIGWEDAWQVTEHGSKLLTIEFISTLDFDDDNVRFKMFNKPFTLPWKTLSIALGFSNQCVVNIAEIL
ncbi:unnamed protein product [Urochloa humidicola]